MHFFSHDVSGVYTSDWTRKNVRVSNRQDSPKGDESI